MGSGRVGRWVRKNGLSVWEGVPLRALFLSGAGWARGQFHVQRNEPASEHCRQMPAGYLPTCPSAELPIFSSASALRMAFMRNSQEWMAFAAPSRAMLALK
jgi:hypothetical protein